MKTLHNRAGSQENERVDSMNSRIEKFFILLRESPEAIILTMRFVAFGITCVLIILLKITGKLSFEALPPLEIFTPYIIGTTVVVGFFMAHPTRRVLFFLLLSDVAVISLVLNIIQVSGNPPVALNSLYLIVLIAASLLNKRAIFLLGITTLAGYLTTTYLNSSNPDIFFTTDRVTQVAMFIVFTILAASQSYYFTYIVQKRDEDALKLRDQFVFTTAHDLRAPFALIRLLAEKYEKRQPKTLTLLREDMEAINTNVAMASRLLEDLLLLAKGENVQIDSIPVNIEPVIRQLIKHWEFATEKKNVAVEYRESEKTTVLADPQKLGYVFDNIISNAVKYSENNGTIRIWHELKKNRVITTIENSGYGIDKENLSRIYTIFS